MRCPARVTLVPGKQTGGAGGPIRMATPIGPERGQELTVTWTFQGIAGDGQGVGWWKQGASVAVETST
jgi:hypothetical protein